MRDSCGENTFQEIDVLLLKIDYTSQNVGTCQWKFYYCGQ